ncbi:MAG: serine/threonine protein kinase, CMGC, dual-specificity, partial [Marteilia pararefringens]
MECDVLRMVRNDEEYSKYFVRLKSFFSVDLSVFIVTELLDADLLHIIQQSSDRGLPHNQIILISRQVLKALSFLHSHRTIHGDLKPENVMLKIRNRKPATKNRSNSLIERNCNVNYCHVKLIDFGSCCAERKNLFSYFQSRYYRAPEVALIDANRFVSCKIDIWSAGCLFYEMKEKVPLFEAKDQTALLEMIIARIGLPSTQQNLMNLLEKNTNMKEILIRHKHKRMDKMKRGKVKLGNINVENSNFSS